MPNDRMKNRQKFIANPMHQNIDEKWKHWRLKQLWGF